MATKRAPGSRPGLIRCEHCGEEYSASYKRCPFCSEYDDDFDEETGAAAKSGGKRVASSNKKGGGYGRTSPLQVIAVIISLAVIAAAVWIVVTKLMPAIDRGSTGTVDPNEGISASLPPSTSPSAAPSDVPGVVPSEPVESPDVSPDVSPNVPAPVEGGATGFSLNKSDVTLTPNEVWRPTVTFVPAGTTAQLTWSSDNTSVVTVSADGVVTNVNAGTGQVTAHITATMPNGASFTCIVRCNGAGTATTTPSAAPSSSPSSAPTTYRINNPDFTFYSVGEPTNLRVVGYDGVVTWSSSDTSVATVDSNGLCKAAGTGKRSCTITATLEDGTKLTAIARISIS